MCTNGVRFTISVQAEVYVATVASTTVISSGFPPEKINKMNKCNDQCNSGAIFFGYIPVALMLFRRAFTENGDINSLSNDSDRAISAMAFAVI